MLDLDTADASPALEPLEVAARQTLQRLQPRGVQTAASRFRVSRYNMTVRLADAASLLFNSRTRSLLLLSPEESALYAGIAERADFGGEQVTDRLFFQALVGGGHVVGAAIDELALVRSAYESTRETAGHLTLTIAPTMACNFACGYCFQGKHPPSKPMTPEIQDALIAFVKSRQSLKSLSIAWYGGEPLMGREAIYRLSDLLIAYCDKKGISYSASIVSNAWFLTSEVAAQLYARRIRTVQVTIDGDRESHDAMRPLTSGGRTFDRILDNIEQALDTTALSIHTRVNVGHSNVDRVGAMLDELAARRLAQRGRFRVYFAPIEASTPESGSAYEERISRAEFNRKVLALEGKARQLGLAEIYTPSGGFMGMCVAASKNGYVIAGNGDVHKCWETAHDPSKRTGTILEPGKLQDSVNAKLWSEWTPFDNAICSACKILPMCGGHCAHRFIYNNLDETALPCPSWKWNTADYLFNRAKHFGVVTDDQWLPEEATVDAMQSGERQSPDSLRASQATVLAKVSNLVGRPIDRQTMLAGETALEAAVAVAS